MKQGATSLFEAVKLTRNTYFDKYNHGVGFYLHRRFLLFDGSGFGKDIKIFGTGLSSLAQIDNMRKKF